MGNVSTSVHFPLEPGCENCIYLNHALEDFEQVLDFIIMYCFKTLEFDVACNGFGTASFSVYLGFSD